LILMTSLPNSFAATKTMIQELHVSYRHGKPFAAYLYLPRKSGDKAAHSQEAEAGLVIDFAADGRPIGIEITSPASFSFEALNRVLTSLNLAPATLADIRPLVAA
jgi:uncharacterized protein YuzE